MNRCVEWREIETVTVFTIYEEINTVEELEDLCQDREMAHIYALGNLLRIVGPSHKKTLDELTIFAESLLRMGNTDVPSIY